MTTETWFIMEDNSVGDPLEIVPDDKGVLRHKDGRAVAYAPHGPRTRGGVDAEKERTKAKLVKREATSPNNREMKADDSGSKYKTR